MASEKESQKPGGGGAVNDLTPPGEQTMKYIPSDQKTIQQAPPSSIQQNTVMQPQQTMPQSGSSLGASPISKPPSSLSGKGSAKSGMPTDFGADVALAVDIQDLTGERLLMAAPRMESHGQQCPALNSIPLLAKIGQGGMGAVYYGIHPRLRSEVAVKVLPFHLAEQDPGMIRRFFREAQIAAQVRSPHLCNVMDVNEEAGLFFLVMEYVTGCTAGQYLKALVEKGQQGMPEKDVLDLIIAATEGLWAAHAQGVVHRDIKPDNIMIPYQSKGSKEYDLKRAKLMDLGLARNEESNQSLTGAQSAMGTPGYMAPEQAMDAKTADKRSDVFSMGATIYCLLAGRPPFKAETIMKVLMATMHEPHEPIIKHRPDVSPMLNEILEKTLAKKQDQRFGDAKQLVTALEDCRRLISGEGGAGAFSGAKTFTYATTPGSGTQDTFMNAGKPAAAAGAPKSKGMLYIAAGVAVLAIGGGTAIMMKKNPGPGPGPGPADPGVVKTPDGSGGTGKPLPPITEQTKALLTRHGKLMTDALSSLKKGEIEDAKLSYDLAKSFGVSDYPDARKLETDFDNGLKNIERKKEFDAELKEINRLAEREDYKKALVLVNKWLAAPPDDASKKIAEDKEKSLNALYLNSRKKGDALKLIEEISAYGPEKLDAGLDKLADIKKTFSKPEDEINIKAAALEVKLNRLIKERDDKVRFDRFMAEGKAAEAKKEYDQALTAYLDAKRITPEDKNLIESLKRIQPLMNEAATEAAAKRLGAQVAELLSKANDEFKAHKYDQALEALGTALNLKKDDPDALALKKLIVDAQTEQKNRDEAQRKRNIFTTQLEDVRKAIAGGDLADAREKLAKIDPSFKEDPALIGVNTDLTRKQTELKAREEYTTQLDKLREHIRNRDGQAAKKLLGEVERSPIADASLDNLRKKVKDLLDELDKIQNIDAEYATLIQAGAAFEKTGDDKKEPSDKLNSYEMALPKFMQAKNLKKGADADAKVTAIQNKINKAKADEEQAKIALAKAQKEKEEREAQEKFNRKQFEDRLGAASAAINAGDLGTAQSNLDEASKLFKDDPQLKKVIADLNAKRTESDGKVNAALDLAATKAPKRQFEEALADLQTAAKLYPQRRELTAAMDALSQLKRIDGLASNAAKSAETRLATLDTKANGKGKTERARVAAAQQRLQNLTEGPINTLARSRFVNSIATLRDLESDLSMRQRDLSDSLSAYENALKETTSTTNQGDQDPFKNDPKKTTPKQPDPKPNKNSGKNAGDVNPFD